MNGGVRGGGPISPTQTGEHDILLVPSLATTELQEEIPFLVAATKHISTHLLIWQITQLKIELL